MTTVSNCGIDENGRISGGAAGDQTGREYVNRTWTDFGQNVVLIHPDPKVNALVAAMARNAASNDSIGYDQSQRTTFYTALKANKWNVAGIKAKCEADCSSSTAAIVIGAGNRLGDAKLAAVSKDCYTGNLKAALVKAGYKAYTDPMYTRSGDYLPAGAINLKESGHVNITVTAGPRAGLAEYPAGTYVVTASALNVRTLPQTGSASKIKTKAQLTADGQKHANDKGQLLKGTRMDVSRTQLDAAGNTWGLIPSGWVCMEYKGKSRVRRG